MDQFLHGAVIGLGGVVALTGALKIATWALNTTAATLNRLAVARSNRNSA